MNDTLETNFLCPSSSFLSGIGSVLLISGEAYRYNASNNPDGMACVQDWSMVGQDLRDALNLAQVEGITQENEREQAA